MIENVRNGVTVTGPSGSADSRVMHMSLGCPLISARQDPTLSCLAVPAHGEIARLGGL